MRSVARMAKPRWCGVALMRRALLAITRSSVTRADAASRRTVAGTGAGAGVRGALCSPQKRSGARGLCSHAPVTSVTEETTHACGSWRKPWRRRRRLLHDHDASAAHDTPLGGVAFRRSFSEQVAP